MKNEQCRVLVKEAENASKEKLEFFMTEIRKTKRKVSELEKQAKDSR